MKRVRGIHILFGITLVTLAALGSWWFVFFLRSVQLERTAESNRLVHATVVTALMLGHKEIAPPCGPVPMQPQLEIVLSAKREPQDLLSPIIPLHPQLGVRPTLAARQSLDQKLARRKLMVVGEGSLLFLLLAVCTFMLYRLVQQERRHLRRMEAFVASVSHEMKTPLAGVKSLLQTFVAGRVPAAEQARLLAMGVKETERLEHMIENVLVSGHLRRGGLQVQHIPVAIRPLAEGFVAHRRRTLIDRPEALQLRWAAARQEISAIGDPHAITQILENLCDNALKYGGATPLVELAIAAADGRVEISISDQGQGFAPEGAAELFVPFRRALDTVNPVAHGTGLGLSIAQALARRMGGSLTAHSEGPNKGSRFTLSLKEVRP